MLVAQWRSGELSKQIPGLPGDRWSVEGTAMETQGKSRTVRSLVEKAACIGAIAGICLAELYALRGFVAVVAEQVARAAAVPPCAW